MSNLVVLLPLLMTALLAISIFVLVDSSHVSLPIPLGTRAVTLILPILATANFFYPRVLERIIPERKRTAVALYIHVALQIVQGIITVVLATLYAEGILPGPSLDCNIRTRWQQLWRSHDARSIERIQDAFNCCGLLSLRDMSEPHRGTDTTLCGTMYHRSTSCAGPWTSAVQRNSGLGFAVAVAVGIIQLAYIALNQARAGPRRGAYARLDRSVGAGQADNFVQRIEPGSGSRILEDHEDVSSSHEAGENDADVDSRARGYGSINDESSPLVQPSGLGDEARQWRR